MKRLLALSALFAVLISSAAYAERFTSFPAYGICYRVRCRENPGQNSRVVGYINKGHEVEVLSQRKVVSELWYEVVTAPG